MSNPNLEMLRTAVKNLDYLNDELVYVGGCTTGLFITDTGSAEVRTTKDVDTIVQATTYAEYINISKKLNQLGFQIDTRPDAPLCRWTKNEIVLDVMPINKEILGFTNSWYQSSVENAIDFDILPERKIKVISAPYFCATKIEAFEGRGNGDYLSSHDLEDLITVIDGRIELADEIYESLPDLRNFIAEKFDSFLANRKFCDALPGYLYPDESAQSRLEMLIERLQKIAGFKNL
jgi:hypothetical protein